MWITGKIAAAKLPRTAECGETSIGGREAAVALCGEQRGIAVMAPGGYIWRPRRGDEVLVIKDSVSGERVIAAAKMQGDPEAMNEGEVCIRSNGASIYLKNSGTIEIYGDIRLHGKITTDEDA